MWFKSRALFDRSQFRRSRWCPSITARPASRKEGSIDEATRPRKRRRTEITDYDEQDTSSMIDRSKPLTLKQIGIELPKVPPTQVVSIRTRPTKH